MSKPASRFQAFCSSSIRKRRIRPSLCVAASSLARIHSRRRQLVASTSSIIWRTSCSLLGKIIFSKNIYQVKKNIFVHLCPLPSAASRSPGSHRFPSNNGSRDASTIGDFSALALFFAALSIAGVWAVMPYDTPSKTCRYIPQLLFFRLGSVVESPTPLQASLSFGFCSDRAVLALVRPVVPYTLALSSQRSRSVPRPVTLDVLALLSWRCRPCR